MAVGVLLCGVRNGPYPGFGGGRHDTRQGQQRGQEESGAAEPDHAADARIFIKNIPELWHLYGKLTDWQIRNLLNEPKEEEKEVLDFPDVLKHVWRLRGYDDDEIEMILHWSQVDKLDDDQLRAKMEETGIAR